jgi:hypothetical protein
LTSLGSLGLHSRSQLSSCFIHRSVPSVWFSIERFVPFLSRSSSSRERTRTRGRFGPAQERGRDLASLPRSAVRRGYHFPSSPPVASCELRLRVSHSPNALVRIPARRLSRMGSRPLVADWLPRSRSFGRGPEVSRRGYVRTWVLVFKDRSILQVTGRYFASPSPSPRRVWTSARAFASRRFPRYLSRVRSRPVRPV